MMFLADFRQNCSCPTHFELRLAEILKDRGVRWGTARPATYSSCSKQQTPLPSARHCRFPRLIAPLSPPLLFSRRGLVGATEGRTTVPNLNKGLVSHFGA